MDKGLKLVAPLVASISQDFKYCKVIGSGGRGRGRGLCRGL